MSLRAMQVRGKPRHCAARTPDTRQVRREHHRRERRRAKLDPECTPEYRRYRGWYW